MTAAVHDGAGRRVSMGAWVAPLLALAMFINYVDRGNLATAAASTPPMPRSPTPATSATAA